MSSIQAAQVDRVLDESRDIPSALLLLLATGAGLGAASLYYCQPLLMEISDGLHVRPSLMGLVPTLTQLGYASGVLLLAPLGDRYDRRIIILVKTALLSLALDQWKSLEFPPALLVRFTTELEMRVVPEKTIEILRWLHLWAPCEVQASP